MKGGPMRLLKRGRVSVTLHDQEILCALRPLSGALSAKGYGQYVQDMLRILLPKDTRIAPGDRAMIQSAPYICVSIRAYPGHLAADLRRCSR